MCCTRWWMVKCGNCTPVHYIQYLCAEYTACWMPHIHRNYMYIYICCNTYKQRPWTPHMGCHSTAAGRLSGVQQKWNAMFGLAYHEFVTVINANAFTFSLCAYVTRLLPNGATNSRHCAAPTWREPVRWSTLWWFKTGASCMLGRPRGLAHCWGLQWSRSMGVHLSTAHFISCAVQSSHSAQIWTQANMKQQTLQWQFNLVTVAPCTLTFWWPLHQGALVQMQCHLGMNQHHGMAPLSATLSTHQSVGCVSLVAATIISTCGPMVDGTWRT